MQTVETVKDIQHNCNISDARDHGIYSMCTMVLKLRNLYKWEHHIEPWQEPEPADLLDWIDGKERYWESIAGESYRGVRINGNSYLPEMLSEINQAISGSDLVYGAGYGRSMKAVFFLAEILEERRVENCQVAILGSERAREMASPFAMAQDGTIYIRRDPLRFFLWDQIQELRSSCRKPMRDALKNYGLLTDGKLDQGRFREKLDEIVDGEMNLFIHHEVGEVLQTVLDSETLEKIIRTFPSSLVELVCRTVKDLLADTHPAGVLSYVVGHEKRNSLNFYLAFLDGLRRELFPQILKAWEKFNETGDWRCIEDARKKGRDHFLMLAQTISDLAAMIGNDSDDHIEALFQERLITPLGLGTSS